MTSVLGGILDGVQRGLIVPKIVPITQRYYGPLSTYGGTAQALAVSANTLYAAPFYLPATAAMDQLAVNVTIAGAGGGLLRIGLYGATAAGLPGDLLDASGALAADAPGAKTFTIARTLVAGQLYYVAIVSDVAPSVSGAFLAGRPFGMGDSGTGAISALSRAFAYGALPAAWGTPSAYGTTAPNVVVKAV